MFIWLPITRAATSLKAGRPEPRPHLLRYCLTLKAGKDGSHSLCFYPGSRRRPCCPSGGRPAAGRCRWRCSTPLWGRAGNGQERVSTLVWPHTETARSLTGAGEQVPAAQQIRARRSHQVLGTAQTAKTQVPVRRGEKRALCLKRTLQASRSSHRLSVGARWELQTSKHLEAWSQEHRSAPER